MNTINEEEMSIEQLSFQFKKPEKEQTDPEGSKKTNIMKKETIGKKEKNETNINMDKLLAGQRKKREDTIKIRTNMQTLI